MLKKKVFNMASNSRKEALAAFLTYGTLGLEMGVSVAIGIAMGWFLDRVFKTSPVLTILFMLFGVAAGMRRLYAVWKKLEREEDERNRDQ